MDFKEGIRCPADLIAAIEVAKLHDEDYQAAIYAIHKYKWYNWYQHTHIIEGTEEDVLNSLIFNALQLEHPKIHEDIEDNIDYEITKLYREF